MSQIPKTLYHSVLDSSVCRPCATRLNLRPSAHVLPQKCRILGFGDSFEYTRTHFPRSLSSFPFYHSFMPGTHHEAHKYRTFARLRSIVLCILGLNVTNRTPGATYINPASHNQQCFFRSWVRNLGTLLR